MWIGDVLSPPDIMPPHLCLAVAIQTLILSRLERTMIDLLLVFFLMVLALLLAHNAAYAVPSIRRHKVPVNCAEAVIEEFFDAQTSGLPDWTVERFAPTAGVRQMWHLCVASWDQPWTEGPALRMHRAFDVDCADYDTLVLRQNTGKVQVRLLVETDQGPRETAAIPETRELELELGGATRITGITLEFSAGEQGPFAAELVWILLHDAKAFAYYQRQWDAFTEDWPKLLTPEDEAPPLEPITGIIAMSEEIETLRHKLEAGELPEWERYGRGLESECAGFCPEEDIGEYLGQDGRFARVRDVHRPTTRGKMAPLALWGLVTQQPHLVRLAARTLLARCATHIWDSGFATAFPTNEWNHRSFVQGSIAQEVAEILDLAGNHLTGAAQALIQRRLAENVIGQINYCAWRYDYIHHCNQLPAFSSGRLMAYLMLEKAWPRVKPYTDLAIEELTVSLEGTILPDGGFVEGAGYLQYTLQEAAQAYFYYARARGLPLAEVTPKCLAHTAHFADAVISTDLERCWIAICDGGQGHGSAAAAAFMAASLPESRWPDLYHKACKRSPKARLTSMELLLHDQIPAKGTPPKAFVHLPEMGLIASQRTLGGHPVKLLIMGGKAGAGHTHDDKGSFTLEFAGETYALDPGICQYGLPIANEYKRANRHNMLVPIGGERSFHPQNPLPHDVKPEGRGDENTFEAHIDAAPGWDAYQKWQRSWESPAPDTLVIHDTWELAQGTGVEFYWQTRLPVEMQDDAVIITGQRGRCILTPPKEAEVRLDHLETAGEGPHTRIAFTQHTTKGRISVEAKQEMVG